MWRGEIEMVVALTLWVCLGLTAIVLLISHAVIVDRRHVDVDACVQSCEGSAECVRACAEVGGGDDG